MRTAFYVSFLALAGCSAFGGSFDIAADPPTLVLDNGTDGVVYYVALEANEAAAADLKPDVTTWPSVAAGQTLRLSYDAIGYDEGDTEAVVFWSTGTGYTQERVRL